MKLEFYKPQNKTLAKYIEGYYFIAPDGNSNKLNYWTFPNNFFILSVNQNAEIGFEDEKITIQPSKEKNIAADFVSRYHKPLEIIYTTSVDEITIYFKPLGINHFLPEAERILKLGKMADFNPFEDFKFKMEEIFSIQNREKQIGLLEGYWLSKLNERSLALTPEILNDVESDLKIDEIAQKNNFSRQHLNKLFLKYIGKSPSEYRKIHRFRNSLIKQKNSKNLTELSYETAFYDQSHLIKDFKSLTNNSPNSFFKKVDTNKENIWLFI